MAKTRVAAIVLGGFLALFALAEAAQAEQMVYWTDWDEVHRANLDGSAAETLLDRPRNHYFGGLATDLQAGKVYFSLWNWRYGTGIIMRCNPDGGELEQVLADDNSEFVSLRVDSGAGKLYWFDYDSSGALFEIKRANLDGSNVETLLQQSEHIACIALSPSAGKIYWGGEDYYIRRANLDGTGQEIITHTPGGVEDLAVDSTIGKMYWYNDGGKIYRANPDGSGAEEIVSPGGYHVYLALDPVAGKIYWTESGKIRRANLDGSNPEDVLTASGLSNWPGLIALGPGLNWRMLERLEIGGSNQVPANSQANYTATAYYDKGSPKDVTSLVTWTVEPGAYGSIAGDLLTTAEVGAYPADAVISATYTEGKTTVEAQKPITIIPLCTGGTALEFDGVDDYVLVPRSELLEPDEITIEMWVFLEGEQDYCTRLLRKCGPYSNGYILAADQGEDRFIQLRIANPHPSIVVVKDTKTHHAYIGSWHHLAGVYTTTKAALYIDGSKVNEVIHNRGPMNHLPLSDLYIGQGGPGTSIKEHFKGKIDEVRIWNCEIAPEQILANMHIKLTGNEPNLVAYWDFDQGQGQVAADMSGNGNDGLLGADPCDVDGSDPGWVGSGAPVGHLCSPTEIAADYLLDVLETKKLQIRMALAIADQLQRAQDSLAEVIAGGDYGQFSKGDLVKAVAKMHSAEQHQIQAAADLDNSIAKLADALSSLGIEADTNWEDGPAITLPDLATLSDLVELIDEVSADMGDIAAASEQEQAVIEVLGQILERGDWGTFGLKKGDIVTTRQKIHSALQHQVQAADKLDKSSGKTEDALEALGYEPSGPDPNLAGWWKFDEGVGSTAYDSAGDNDGTLNGAGWTGGKIDGALDFDGGNDDVTIPDSPELRFSGTEPFSVGLWFKRSVDMGQNECLVGKGYNGDPENTNYLLLISGSDDTIHWFWEYGSGTNVDLSSGVTAGLEQWYQVVGVWDGTNQIIYVNGVEKNAAIPAGLPVSSGNRPVVIGKVRAGTSSGGYNFNGVIDDVRIYDRALLAVDVAQLYGAAMGPKAFGPNPAAGATLVDPNTVLGWASATGADSHDVYFGTSFEDVNSAMPDSNEFMGNFDVTSFDPAGLELGTGYYWRIDEKYLLGTAKGNVWSFTTVPLPGQAHNPNPADSASGVGVDADLSWSAGTTTTSHNVYFGTSNPPAFIGNQAGTTYDPGVLQDETTYYWRIDAVGPGGVTAGAVWNFTTKSMGPVAWWKFDEGTGSTAYDSAGDNDGTVNGGAGFTAGKVGSAVSLDGINDYVSVPASPSLDFRSSYSIAAWLRPTATPSERMVWFGYHSGIPKKSLHLAVYTNGMIRFGLYGDDLNTAAGTMNFGQWNHVVVTYDYGTDTSRIYVDGSLEASGNSGPYLGGLVAATIGKWNVTFQSQNRWNGLIDDVRVYDRALSAAEVTGLYDAAMDPVAWWKFDEGTGSTAYDSVGDNDGTVNGAAWTSGLIDGALYFDGSGDYVDTTDFDPGAEFTVSMWVDPLETYDGQSFIGKHTSAGDNIFVIGFWLGGYHGRIRSDTYTSGTKTTGWQHISAVVKQLTSSRSEVVFYKDGAVLWSHTLNDICGDMSGRPWTIGQDWDPHGRSDYFNGSIDDVRIYDRALSAAEVAQLYSAVQGPKASSPDPNDGAGGIDTATMLSWSAGPGAVSHDVYLGTDFNNVNNATTGSAEFKGNQTATTYNPGGLNFLTTYYWRIDENDGSDTHKGNVWSFTTTAPPAPPPGQAGSPNPLSGATDVSMTADLSWSAGSNATSHDVYFGTANPPASVGNQAGTTYDPGTMEYGTTYYWRIDEVGPGGTTTGTVWNFATESLVPPGQAGTPNPTDGATGVALLAQLSWTAGTGASSHDVYFGTDNPPAFIGNQVGTTYITGIMNYETTYYWRIDEVNPASTTTGQLWSFVTAAPGFLEKADFPNPTDGAMNVSIGIDLSWSQPIGATSYNVYFGTDATPDIDDFKGNQTAATFDPGTLDYKTTYYWRIDVENLVGTATGDVWSFTTELAPHEEGAAGDLFWHNIVDKPWQGGSRPAKLDDFVGVHPRLLLTQTKVDELKTKITSGTHKDIWDIIKAKADSYLGQSPNNDPDNETPTRADGDAIPWLAFAYLMTDDTTYLNKGVSWMTTVANYGEWDENRSLAAAHCLMGVSLGYDWLYNAMTATERDTIKTRLAYFADIMGASDESAAKKPQHRERYLTNHCQVEYAGLAAAGLALYDDTSVAGGEDWLRRAYNIFDMAYQLYAEDGSDTEGHQYYGLLTEFQMHFNKMAKEFLGRDFYQESKWLQNAGDFILYSGLPDFTAANCVMRFGDTTRNNYVSHGPIYQMFNLASEYGDPQYQWLALEMLDRGIGTIDRMGWANLIWYDETIPAAEPGADGLSAFGHFEDTGWVTSRSDWGADAVMVGFKCGPHNGHKALKYYERQVAEDWPNTVSPNSRSFYGMDYHELNGGHGHPDVGHFNVYAYGQWLAADDGKTVTGDTKQTSYHSTLLVNGEGQLGEGSKYFDRTTVISAAASSSIIKAKSTAEYDYVVGDAGNIYKDSNLTRFYRHFIYIKPDIIVVVDELESTPSTNIQWRMRTAPTATVTGSGNEYLVSSGSARMDIDFLNPSGLSTAVSGDFLTATLTSTGSDLLVTVLHPRQDTDPAGTAVLTSSSGSILKLTVAAGVRTMAVRIDLANQHLMITSDYAASNPTPADGTVDVDVNEDLSWTAGTGATSHDVYFGTANPPASIGNQPGTTFEPGTLENGVTYYWQIDEVTASGTVTGPVWSFTTEAVEAGLWALVEQRFANSMNLFETDAIYAYPHNYPRSTDPDGEWRGDGYPGHKHEGHWASGFWPGSLWYLYGRTGEQQWKDWAVDWTTPLERHQYRVNDHESGFLIYRSYGFGHNLTGEAGYVPIILQACESLVTRYDANVGCIKSWYRMVNPNDPNFRVITDGMMMLEMLYWGVKNGGDPSWYDIAVSHSLKTMENNVRPDGSVWQIVDYDQATGVVVDKWNKQGYDPDSTWSRGQAWGICGFAIAYRETGDVRFLETSKRCADYFIDNLPADKVPYWDFDAPGIPNEPKDSSAAAIAASGMLELSTLVADQRDKDRYFGAACDILDSLASPVYLAADPNMAILLHGTGRANPTSGTPDTWEIDCGLIYGDHFFTEALRRKEEIIGR